MQSTNWLLEHLRDDYPQFSFVPADEFWWSSTKQTIYFDPGAIHSQAFSLHELSHAILRHEGYRYDIDLLKLERDAWHYAKETLARTYSITVDDEVIQDNLDSYRTWLHARSTCPGCQVTGLQTKSQHYRCLACDSTWRVNEARLCALRRYTITK
jgi:hypothetical protein